MTWKPIETAPKDGTIVVTGKPSEWVKAFFWVPYPIKSFYRDGLWRFTDGRQYDPQPTHWMPLPAPPEAT